ncbi:ABC transporter ATP-binding protein [Nocardioides deserti]|uniref:ABC transporter ATP-binding protein n=1 Tax=Nocardioides deserti TaxID=1588644 RepID=A0ABR6U486_9ACTN|nr:ABC transporter ATP-binding protein [Nocardioides deserti]MBC2959234.1 ABC transporter ATP-binding protein [Nocardioides deserti]GGO68312.1 ABC transporter ATP-binding protein [Nocardioides deserti]
MSHRENCVHRAAHGDLLEVTAEGVTVRLGDRTVLDSVGLRAAGGRVTGLLGPNGSGKTTLLHVLAGLRRPDAGVVRVGGTDLRSLPDRRRARTVALVEQHAATTVDLTVREVVTLGRLPHRGRLGGAARDTRGADVVEEVLEMVGLAPLAERLWGTLSGGERQRAHLGRTLAQEPEVLLLDEPTNHLDLGQQLRFLSLVRELGLTAVAALHDLELAAAFCDDVVVLDGGRVRGDGTVGDALTAPLLGEVYGVEASLAPHPRLPRQHLVWDGPSGGPR